MSYLSSASSLLLDCLFPPLCLSCRKHLKTREEQIFFLCAKCKNAIAVHEHIFCPNCGNRLPQKDPRLYRSACAPRKCDPREIRVNFKSACCSAFVMAAASSYENPVVRELIHALKYQNLKIAMIPIKELIIKPYLKNVFADSFIRSFEKDSLFADIVIIPVPLHKTKERKRGFNQSELIAEAFMECFHEINPIGPINPINPIRPISLILSRARATRTQTEIKDYKSRAENVKDSFTINKPTWNSRLLDPRALRVSSDPRFDPRSSTIVLVDDVFTSGATLNEAARVLKSAGAKNILAFVLAKT